MGKPGIVVWTLAKVLAAVTLLGWGALHMRKFDTFFSFVLPAFGTPVGLILLVVGGIAILGCAATLSARGILERPNDRFFPKQFIVSGPFRYVRNPMSLAVVVATGGLALFERSTSILLFAILLSLLLHLLVVWVEEPGLERRFGESYRNYKRSVNRWLPIPHRDKINIR